MLRVAVSPPSTNQITARPPKCSGVEFQWWNGFTVIMGQQRAGFVMFSAQCSDGEKGRTLERILMDVIRVPGQISPDSLVSRVSAV